MKKVTGGQLLTCFFYTLTVRHFKGPLSLNCVTKSERKIVVTNHLVRKKYMIYIYEV